MKFNKNIALFILILFPAFSQASVEEITNSVYGQVVDGLSSLIGKQQVDDFEKITKLVVDQAGQATEQLQEDSGNMFADYKATVCSMKNPMIETTYATLKMQHKNYPAAAEAFKAQAVSPYYAPGFISFIAGSSLLTTALVSNDKKTLLTGSAVCFATSLGCYYKSRSDIIDLRKTVIANSIAQKAENDMQ